MKPPFPFPVFELGPLVITDTVVVTLVLTLLLVVGGWLAARSRAGRRVLEPLYDMLAGSILEMTSEKAEPLVPLILTLWLFIGAANLIGLVPGVLSPTRDLALTAALALVSYLAGHAYAFKTRGIAYLKQYISPHPLLLPFNIVGEVSRTLALALRLFGNMISGSLVGAIVVYLAGLLVPIPLMILSVLTSLVQAYIFGVLTLVFAVSSVESVSRTGKTALARTSQKQDPPS
jgi:F-type H+-transporting ATPase subunit a